MSTSYYSQYKTDKESENPLDTVSCIVFNKFQNVGHSFIASSWDGFVRHYDIQTSGTTKLLLKKWEYFFQHPVLSCDLTPDMFVIAGLANGEIVVVDMRNSDNLLVLGSHSAPILKVFWYQQQKMIFSLGHDNLLKFYNFEFTNNSYQKAQFKLPAKTSTAAFSFPFLLVSSIEAKVALISLENLSNLNIPNQYQDIDISPVCKLISASIHADEKKVAFGAADGQFIVTDYTTLYNGLKISKPVVIKTQKKSSTYHTNSTGQLNSLDLGYKDRRYCFALYGGSQDSSLHDVNKNKKIKTLTTGTVSAVKISPDCEFLVYATGSDWMKGLQELNDGKKPKLIGLKINTSDFY